MVKSERIIGILEGVFRNGVTRDEAIKVLDWNVNPKRGTMVYSGDDTVIFYYPSNSTVKIYGVTAEENEIIAEYFN